MPKFLQSVAVLLFASFLVSGQTGCNNPYNDKVVGVWDWQIAGTSILVTINKDGTGSLQGPAGEQKVTWRLRGSNFIFNDGTKDLGFVIDSANENTITGSDPQSPGQKIIWVRKK